MPSSFVSGALVASPLNAKQQNTVAIIGATGLIGNLLLQRLTPWLASNSSNKLIVCARHKPELLNECESEQINFINICQVQEKATWQQQLAKHKVDVAFNCLGTTIKQAKSRQAFKKIDYDLVIEFATIVKSCGVKLFSSVSSLGASEKSPIFYSKVKGLVEQQLKNIAFEHLSLWQPSLLLGDRVEKRSGEDIGKVLMPLLNPLMFGPLADYQAIKAMTVASAMFYESGLTLNLPIDDLAKGVFCYKKRDMLLITKNFT